MIQILGLRNNTHAFFEKGWVANSVAEILLNPEAFTKDISEYDMHNIYFTAHDCLGQACRDWKSQSIIPIDIDHIDPDKVKETAIVVCAAVGIDFNKTGVVFSGHGLQLHIQLETPILDTKYFTENRELYKVMCQGVNAALDAAKLPGKMDSSVFSARRLLRMPNTINRKQDKPDVNSYVVQSNMEMQGFSLALACGAEEIITKHQIHPKAFAKFPPSDEEGVLQGCEFLKWTKANQAKVSEPQWYAMLSIVGRLKNGKSLVQEYSQGHPDYTPDKTTFKTEQALASAGPRTCEGIDAVWNNCKSCKFYKSRDLVSPISIISESFIATEGTGFHNLIEGANGEVKAKPDYQDLVKFFKREVGKVVTPETGKKWVYSKQKRHWESLPDVALEAFAETHFNPKPNNNTTREFVGCVGRQNYIPGNWLDESTVRKLNLQNGILDLATFSLVPHSSDYGFRHILPYAYDEQAKCPRFDRFLEEVTLGRKDLINILLEFMGYAISGDECWAAKALILLGEGGNGKSTLNRVLKSLVPKDTGYSTLNMSALNVDTKRTMLEGRLFNIGDENSPKAFMNNETFRSLVSGDDVDVKHLYLQPYSIRNRAKMIFNCNKMPESGEHTPAILRRLLFVPFDATFELGNEGTDTDIDKKLAQELPGILNRCIEGYMRLQAQGKFTESTASDEILEDYRIENGSIEVWFANNIEKGSGSIDINAELYPAYFQHCRRNGINEETSLNFCRLVTKFCKKHGFDKKRVEEKGLKYQRIYNAKIKSGF